ncbi:MAG: zinc dependent phospholipase C family protein [Coriobacteriia bacterium]|nr:zinc dependent phospholipase C family protein [Coriobacteriia bacterium]
MPALLTHDFFGQDVWAQGAKDHLGPPEDSPLAQQVYELFLLGNQGPDPFFYLQRVPRFVQGKRFGSLLHTERVNETIESFQRIALCMPQPQQTLLKAYLMGFICHYALDSTAHPLVYAQQYAICDAGVKGLDRRDGNTVHVQMEADLDMMLLRQRRGLGPREYNYTLEVLQVSEDLLALLASAYTAMTHEVHHNNYPAQTFSQGVRDMRLTIRLLYSPRGIKRALIGGAERLFSRHSFAQALSPRCDVGETCDFDNHEHAAWTNPFTGAVSTASFADLYAQAITAAITNCTTVLEGHPASQITHNLDFHGAPLS